MGLVHKRKGVDAQLMDVQIKFIMEECAAGMGQNADDAALMDVPLSLKREECASGMEQKSNYAALMDALILHKEKEFARDTEPIRMYPAGQYPNSKQFGKRRWKHCICHANL
jgi:hypothetical protein